MGLTRKQRHSWRSVGEASDLCSRCGLIRQRNNRDEIFIFCGTELMRRRWPSGFPSMPSCDRVRDLAGGGG
jgi:hypothetical protein